MQTSGHASEKHHHLRNYAPSRHQPAITIHVSSRPFQALSSSGSSATIILLYASAAFIHIHPPGPAAAGMCQRDTASNASGAAQPLAFFLPLSPPRPPASSPHASRSKLSAALILLRPCSSRLPRYSVTLNLLCSLAASPSQPSLPAPFTPLPSFLPPRPPSFLHHHPRSAFSSSGSSPPTRSRKRVSNASSSRAALARSWKCRTIPSASTRA